MSLVCTRMRRLTIDQGNSYTKFSFFSDEKMVKHFSLNDDQLEKELSTLLVDELTASAILSSVRSDATALEKLIRSKTNLLVLHYGLRFPFAMKYATPQSLGTDRLANAAGAVVRFQKRNCLVVDCGTCITYTIVKSGELLGGAIAPGLHMRLNALSHFTGKLPLVNFVDAWPEIVGTSTEASICAGVIRAIVLETDGMIEQYCSEINDLNVLLTGGMMQFFEKHLKSPIFAAPFLTSEGLHEILLLNEN